MRTIQREDITPGTWFDGSKVIPAENIPVLVCTNQHEYWVDRIIGRMWSTCVMYPDQTHLFWQLPSLPVPIMWELDGVQKL